MALGRELGKKPDILNFDSVFTMLEFHVMNPSKRPFAMPALPSGAVLVCGWDQGLGERMIVPKDLEAAQELWDKYAQGFAIRICWYQMDEEALLLEAFTP